MASRGCGASAQLGATFYAWPVLLIVRHGETLPNAQGRLLGRADPTLTETGRAQARALAALLPRPDVVISSPLRRARDTAAQLRTAVDIDERWTERDYGELEGELASEASGAASARWRTDVMVAPPGGESIADLSTRVRDACEELAMLAGSAVVVVVTHVSPIKAAVAWALDVPDTIATRMYVEDGSVTRIDFDTGTPIVRWFNRYVPQGS